MKVKAIMNLCTAAVYFKIDGKDQIYYLAALSLLDNMPSVDEKRLEIVGPKDARVAYLDKHNNKKIIDFENGERTPYAIGDG